MADYQFPITREMAIQRGYVNRNCTTEFFELWGKFVGDIQNYTLMTKDTGDAVEFVELDNGKLTKLFVWDETYKKWEDKLLNSPSASKALLIIFG